MADRIVRRESFFVSVTRRITAVTQVFTEGQIHGGYQC